MSSDQEFVGPWFKSKRSNPSGSCVEVRRRTDGGMSVRDTKDNGEGPVLTFTGPEWKEFVGGVKDGEFDIA